MKLRLPNLQKNTQPITSTGFKQKLTLKKGLSFGLIASFAVVGIYLLVQSKAAVPTGTYTNWTWPAAPTGNWNIEHGLTIEEVTPDATYFWSHQFKINGGDGGYIGLQSHGNSVSGAIGKTAVFSIFGAGIEATPGNCKVEQAGFDGYQNSGSSCRIPFDWVLGRKYQLKAGITGSDAGGTWWTGTIQDTATGAVTEVGRIKVPTSWKGVDTWSVMWTEYFGGQPANCNDLAYSRVRFYTPRANNGATSPVGSSNTYASGGTCNNSTITNTGDGVIQQMGAQKAQHDPIGWVDEANCSYIGGWAKDEDTANPIDVHIYFEQPVGVPGSVGWNIGSANIDSSDVGRHRFRRAVTDPSIPINPFDGQVHKVYAYGINDGPGTNPELSMNPRPATFGPCAAPVKGPATPPTTTNPTPTNPTPAPTPTNTAPDVTLASVNPPVAPSTFTLRAKASDKDGIKGVTFFSLDANGNLQKEIGTDTVAPYEMTLTKQPAATYRYAVRATDTKGLSSTSKGITVTVNPAPAAVPSPAPSVQQAPTGKPGDVNGDGAVDVLDLATILINWEAKNATAAQGDLTGDKTVNVFDLALVLLNWTAQ